MLHSLKERNLLVVAAAQAEERERQQVQEEIGEVEQHILAILPLLEASSDQCKKQVRPYFLAISFKNNAGIVINFYSSLPLLNFHADRSS